MDKHYIDPIAEKVRQLDELADRVLGPIELMGAQDHPAAFCAGESKYEHDLLIVINPAKEAADAYTKRKEQIPPHVQSAMQITQTQVRRGRTVGERIAKLLLAVLTHKGFGATFGLVSVGVMAVVGVGRGVEITKTNSAAQRASFAALGRHTTSASAKGLSMINPAEPVFTADGPVFSAGDGTVFPGAISLSAAPIKPEEILQTSLLRELGLEGAAEMGDSAPSLPSQTVSHEATSILLNMSSPPVALTSPSDVNTTQAPEPNTLALAGVSILFGLAVTCRRRYRCGYRRA